MQDFAKFEYLKAESESELFCLLSLMFLYVELGCVWFFQVV